nr:MAG TPA: hypothetical protein [Caudoviricetes sp.]
MLYRERVQGLPSAGGLIAKRGRRKTWCQYDDSLSVGDGDYIPSHVQTTRNCAPV